MEEHIKTQSNTHTKEQIIIKTKKNHVIRPYKILRSILHESFPILYLPEYISRRCCQSWIHNSVGINGGLQSCYVNDDETTASSRSKSSGRKRTRSGRRISLCSLSSSPSSSSSSSSSCLPFHIIHEYNVFLETCRKDQKKRKKNRHWRSAFSRNQCIVNSNNKSIGSNHASTTAAAAISTDASSGKRKNGNDNDDNRPKRKLDDIGFNFTTKTYIAKRQKMYHQQEDDDDYHDDHHLQDAKQKRTTNDTDVNGSNGVDNDMIRRLVRMIIIPLSSKLIAELNSSSLPMHSSDGDDNDMISYSSSPPQPLKTAKTNLRSSESNDKNNFTNHGTFNNGEDQDIARNKTRIPTTFSAASTIVNPYNTKQSTAAATKKTIHKNKSSNSQPSRKQNESLISIVDGVISSLVHKRHRMKRNEKRKQNRIINNTKSSNQYSSCQHHTYYKYKSKYNNKKIGYDDNDGNNHHLHHTKPYYELCHGRNLLSEGYSIATSNDKLFNSGTKVSSSSSSSSFFKGNNNKTNVINPSQQCRNMPPGVQCTKVNSCASFCRCDSVMKYIHGLIGDDLMRELLLHCIILVPVHVNGHDSKKTAENGANVKNTFRSCSGSSSHTSTHSRSNSASSNTSALMDYGNYFQICGPPLSSMTLAARPGDEYSHHSNVASRDETTTYLDNHQKSLSSANKPKKAVIQNDLKNIPFPKTNDIIHPDWVVPKSSIMYSESFVKKVGLPPSHLLNQWKNKNANKSKIKDGKSNRQIDEEALLTQLLDDIVKVNKSNGERASLNQNKKARKRSRRNKRWKRLRVKGISICKEIFDLHYQCDYSRLLARYCPLPQSLMQNNKDCQQGGKNMTLDTNQGSIDGSKGGSLTAIELVKEWSDSNQVVSFLSAVLKNVFPLSFWGSDYNFHRVLEIMKIFVQLRRHEQLPMKLMTNGLRVLDIDWLFNSTTTNGDQNHHHPKKKKKKSDHEAATRLVMNQMKWLYCSFIMPLLRSTFYITDTEFTGRQVHYYRKPVWSKLRGLAMDQLLKKQFREIDKDEAIEVYNRQQLGFGRLRLLPKETGIRPIEVLCKNEALSIDKRKRGSGNLFRQKLSTNMMLKQTFDVLKYEYKANPSQFGVGLFGFNCIYERLHKFVNEFKQLCQKSNERIPLYFASVDIRKCYDNIDQDHIFYILSKVMNHDKYCIQHSDVLNYHSSNEVHLKKRVKNVGKPEHIKKFIDAVEDVSKGLYSSIVVASATCNTVSKESLMKILDEHLSHNVVISRQKYGKKYLMQQAGIPQGSVLSTMLCNFYYGDESIEKSLLDGVLDEGSPNLFTHVHLVVRIVDDFLVITTSEKAITRFLLNMNKGNPTLGVSINENKTRVSCDLDLTNMDGGKSENKLPMDSTLVRHKDRKFFKWCGLLLDTESCAVQLDYGRFIDNAASNSLTVNRVSNEGMNLLTKLQNFVRPRCQPIFYDATINSDRDIHINFCQAIAFCAVKSIHYIDGMNGGIHQNMTFVFKCLIKVIHYAFKLINTRLRKMQQRLIVMRDNGNYLMDKNDFLWLGSHSYQMVLQGSKCAGFQKLSHWFRSHRKKLRTQATHQYLSKVADSALETFHLNRFSFNHD